MIAVVETLNAWSEAWAGLVWAVVWQSTLIAAAVAFVAFLLRRASPALRYWLWQLVAIKLLLMPFWVVAVPMPWFTGDDQAEAATGVAASEGAGLGGEEMTFDLELRTLSQADSAGQVPAPPSWWQRLATAGGVDRWTWQSWLLAGWLIVLGGQILRVALQRLRLARLLRRAIPVTDPALLGLRDDLADQLKLVQRPTIVTAEFDGSPFVCRVRSPVLVLPRGVTEELDLDQFRQILAHELAHVGRRDLVWGWITETARILYFFHPIAHWVSYRVRLERELACDQIAMHLSGFDAGSYAETLVQVASRASEPSLLRATANTSAGLNGAGTPSQKTHHPRKEQLK